jgi:peroxiredoxin
MVLIVRNILFSLFVVWTGFSMTGCAQAQNMFGGSLSGQEAPDITLPKSNGGSSSFRSVMSGKKAVMIFWTTWCPHCLEQLRTISQNRARLDEQGIALLLVNIGESPAQVQRFLQMKGYDFDVFLDTEGQAAEMYRVMGIPAIVLVGADGKVRTVQHHFPAEYENILK